ncbi:NAD-dependent epimerase/dehydratase family protein [Dactylosporangium siamense]|uniref:NAD-dependent epimerase/dehydratase family protein n=1 Tax=Dactylosporangium siamense TaxID=685454 RepID=UPI001941FE77|nr:NAD-dependent epimerase/dehydratase family protein [Dactylosporangium siamense]
MLFIGGSGVISSACADVAVRAGHDLTVLNRGVTSRPLPAGVTTLRADHRDPAAVRAALRGREYDVVVDWIAFTPQHVRADIALFAGRTGQYVFISTTSVYRLPAARLPLTESSPLGTPGWQYARDKIACEELLAADGSLPVTIVRPGHTYDRTLVPLVGGWTALARLREGRPVVVHGDGLSLWTLTHHTDFAAGFVPLLGHPAALGRAFQIVSDELLTWDAIVGHLAEAAGVRPRIVHVPSDVIAAADPEWGALLLDNQAHSASYDTAALRSLVPAFRPDVPFSRGAREIVAWFDADPGRRRVDPHVDALTDLLVAGASRR